jgi:hypothetical protein
MNHIEFAESESAALSCGWQFEAWCEAVEKIVWPDSDTDLDGDEREDGYSLDFAFEAYDRGESAEKYAAHVIDSLANHAAVQCERA